MDISCQLVNPGFERESIPEGMPVLNDPVKSILREVLADGPVKGQFQQKVIDPDMVSFKQPGYISQVSVLYPAHDNFVRISHSYFELFLLGTPER